MIDHIHFIVNLNKELVIRMSISMNECKIIKKMKDLCSVEENVQCLTDLSILETIELCLILLVLCFDSTKNKQIFIHLLINLKQFVIPFFSRNIKKNINV